MTRQDALRAVDEGFTDSLKDLFDKCRKNVIDTGLDEAAAEFARGFDNLLKFNERAVAIVEKAFPG
jgi:hypothetical protein